MTLTIETKRNNHFIRDGTIAALAILYDKHIIKVGETVYSTPYSLALREKQKKKRKQK